MENISEIEETMETIMIEIKKREKEYLLIRDHNTKTGRKEAR
jgi:hypothetical protein